MTQDTNNYKVMIVDDHPLLRAGLESALSTNGKYDIFCQTDDISQAVHIATNTHPDIAIIELSHTDGLTGIDLIKELRSICPEAKILILSTHDEKIYAERSIRAGANGYIMKNCSLEEFSSALETIIHGEVYLSEEMSKKLVSGMVGKRHKNSTLPEECLTDRELQILQLIGEGIGTSHIAEKLHISAKTVETHRANIKNKFNLPDSAALVSYAIKWRHSFENPMCYSFSSNSQGNISKQHEKI